MREPESIWSRWAYSRVRRVSYGRAGTTSTADRVLDLLACVGVKARHGHPLPRHPPWFSLAHPRIAYRDPRRRAVTTATGHTYCARARPDRQAGQAHRRRARPAHPHPRWRCGTCKTSTGTVFSLRSRRATVSGTGCGPIREPGTA